MLKLIASEFTAQNAHGGTTWTQRSNCMDRIWEGFDWWGMSIFLFAYVPKIWLIYHFMGDIRTLKLYIYQIMWIKREVGKRIILKGRDVENIPQEFEILLLS